MMRHRNPLLCTMAHTAFYLFCRWNIAGETPLLPLAPAVVWPSPHQGRACDETDGVRHAARLDQQDVHRGERDVVEEDTRGSIARGQTHGIKGRQRGSDPPCRATEQRRPDELLPHPPPAEVHVQHGRFQPVDSKAISTCLGRRPCPRGRSSRPCGRSSMSGWRGLIRTQTATTAPAPTLTLRMRLTFARTKTRTRRTVEIWPPRAFYVY